MTDKLLSFHPLISIITIVFNDILNIEKTIQSVINQSYIYIEYIIIDGGSTDGTVDIIKKYENKISCWVSEPDKGIYDAMNKGIFKASGKWINFMNSGDSFCNNNVIEDCIQKIPDNKNHKIIYGNFIWKNGDAENFVIAKSSIKMHYTMPSCHQSFLIDTQLHKEIPYDTNYKIAADFDFLCKMKSKGIRFLKIPVTISVYQAGGLSENMDEIKGKEFNDIFHKYNKFPQNIWYQYVVSSKIFDSGWRAYYITTWIKCIIGKNNYNKIAKQVKSKK